MSLHQTERPTADVDDLAWEREAGVTWSIRRCAEVTGMPQSTLRTWERRYGLGPSARTAGGHRRYSAADLDRLRLMCRLLRLGAPTAAAALRAREGTDQHVRSVLDSLGQAPA